MIKIVERTFGEETCGLCKRDNDVMALRLMSDDTRVGTTTFMCRRCRKELARALLNEISIKEEAEEMEARRGELEVMAGYIKEKCEKEGLL